MLLWIKNLPQAVSLEIFMSAQDHICLKVLCTADQSTMGSFQ